MMSAIVLCLFFFIAGAGCAWILAGRNLRKQMDARAEATHAFLSASANQLRTPLNQIVGALQMLDFQKMELTEKQEELLGVLNDGSYNLRGALMDILDILDLQADRLKIEPSQVDFRKTLTVLERRFAKRARKKGIALHFDARKLSHWHFEMDQMRYMQCISTVLAQCVKQTGAGAVGVSFDLSAAGKQKSGDLVAYIKDSSAGMDQYMTEAYFSPDKYDINAEMMDAKGRRLALMLARMLVRKMGGDLTVKSAFGSGVTFQLSVPVKLAPAPAHEAEHPHEKPVERARAYLAGKTILVADDDPLNLMIMKEFLERGHAGAVLTAANGLEAVKIIARNECALVFMDIQMPVLDGLTAAREIRNCGQACAGVPIVALTTAVRPDDIARYKEAGMNAVLAKPVIVDVLFETIEPLLAGKNRSIAA